MLPESALPVRLDRGQILPGFLDARDLPWLRVLAAEIDRFQGRPLRELLDRLRQPLPCATPHHKRRAALAVLLRLWKSEPDAPVPPAQAREVLFRAGAEEPTRDRAWAAAARALGVETAAVARSLFADVHGERLVRAPEVAPSPQEIALRTNQLIARGLLARARRVRIKVQGAVRPLVRQAKLRGLLCTVTQASPPILELSGPFALFRHTLLYGRALGELVAFLPHCDRFGLRADCVLRGEQAVLDLHSGDPIFPAAPPKPYDSKLEERFARDFRKAAPDWDILREPEPVAAAGTLIFPDFLIRERLRPERACFVEIVGFWSPAYLARKLGLLRRAHINNLILCIDETRACGDGDGPVAARIVRFRRRVDPAAIVAAAETLLRGTP